MEAITKAEFAERAGVSRAMISKLIKNGQLVVRPDTKLDVKNPVNQDYLRFRKDKQEKEAQEKSSGKKTTKGSRKKKGTQERKKDLGDVLDDLEGVNLEDLSDAISSGKLGLLSRSSADRLKVIEQVRAIQLKTDKERNNLIERALVRRVLGQIYTIDVNEFRTLGLNLAPELAAAAGIDDSEIILKIGELIEKEVFKVLQHIKRLINDFLKEIEAETIE